MELVLIAALGENQEIGYQNDLPWPRIRKDMQRFRELTTGHPIVMGRSTYESIPDVYRPLANRLNVVLSTTMSTTLGISVCSSLDDALDGLQDGEITQQGIDTSKCYVIGGARVYRDTLDSASRLELTHVHGTFKADTFFPEIDWNEWNIIKATKHDGFSFATYERVNV